MGVPVSCPLASATVLGLLSEFHLALSSNDGIGVSEGNNFKVYCMKTAERSSFCNFYQSKNHTGALPENATTDLGGEVALDAQASRRGVHSSQPVDPPVNHDESAMAR